MTAIDKLDRNFAVTAVADGLSWYDIRGQSADGSYTLQGSLIVTSHNLVTAWIVRKLPTGSVASFYTGKVNPAKKALKLTGQDATGAKHRINAGPQ